MAILPATERDGAMMIAERMRAAIQSMVPCPKEPDLDAVTVSIGVAVAKIERSSSRMTPSITQTARDVRGEACRAQPRGHL